jgi:hypothetical protein
LKGFSLAQIEEILLNSYKNKIYASLFKEHYKDGGKLIDFQEQQHGTGEKEAVNLQWISLTSADSDSSSITRFVFLEYLLSTYLKRVNPKGKIKSLPSLVHLIRGADFPQHSEAVLQGKNHNLSFTLIIQKTSTERERSILSVEVIGGIDIIGFDIKQQEKYLRKLVEGLTQLQRLFLIRAQIPRPVYPDATTPQTVYADATTPQTVYPDTTTSDEQMQTVATAAATFNADVSMSPPTDTEQNKTPSSPVINCGICKKKFNAFRWRHQCELCSQYTCNQCYSVIANPTCMRRKTRVCNSCLYEPNAAATAISTAREVRSNTVPFTQGAEMNGGKKTKQSTRVAEPAETGLSDAESRPAAPHDTVNSSATKRRDPAQTDTTRGRGASARVRSSKYFSDNESDYDSQTEEDGGLQHRLSRASRKLSSTIRKSHRSLTSLGDFSQLMTGAPLSRTSSTASSTSSHTSVGTNDTAVSLEPVGISVRQPPTPSIEEEATITNCISTHEVDYQLDFNWFHSFPKAPQPIAEPQRLDYIVSMGLDDEQTLMTLKKDNEIQSFLKKAIALTPIFNGASLNIITKAFVVCVGSLIFDGNVYQEQKVEANIRPRVEAISSYALYHDEPFYVADLEEDVRFQAHPIVIKMEVKRLLSLPIYSTSKANGNRMCIGGLDLWYKTPRFMESDMEMEALQGSRSDHGSVPLETVQELQSIALQLSMRIENITSHLPMKTQRQINSARYNGHAKRAYSVDSFISESKGRRTKLGLDFNSDLSPVVILEKENEPIIAGSKHLQQGYARRLSSIDIENTIEALLNQVNQTNHILRQSQTIH